LGAACLLGQPTGAPVSPTQLARTSAERLRTAHGECRDGRDSGVVVGLAHLIVDVLSVPDDAVASMTETAR
jgi:hypothetical protein